MSGKILRLLHLDIYRIYTKCSSVAPVLLAVGPGRAREKETEGGRRFTGVDLGVLSAAAADIPMGTGAFLGDRTDILPSEEDRTKTPRRRLWEELLTSPQTRTGDTDISWLQGVAGISVQSQRFNSITPEAPPDLELSGF